MGERKSKLYKLVNGIGDYWVIAKDPTEAEFKLNEMLTKAEYGNYKERVVTEIHIVANEMYSGIGISQKFLIL